MHDVPMIQEQIDPGVLPEFRHLPPAPKALEEVALAHGWRVAHQFSVDNGGSPFVTVHVISRSAYYFRITWHTRMTGTYRLFSKIMRSLSNDGAGRWDTAPSLTRIREIITTTEGEQHEQDTAAVEAQRLGAEIREVRTNLPVRHAPRSPRDPRPWVVRSDGLDTEFRLAGTECVTWFPDESRCPSDPTAPTVERWAATPESFHPLRRWTREQQRTVFGDSIRLD